MLLCCCGCWSVSCCVINVGLCEGLCSIFFVLEVALLLGYVSVFVIYMACVCRHISDFYLFEDRVVVDVLWYVCSLYILVFGYFSFICS